MEETRFLYDGNNVLQEQDGTGTVTAQFTYQSAAYARLVSQQRSGDTSWYQFDGIHNTVALTDDTGTVSADYEYDAWGRSRATTGATPNAHTYRGEFVAYYRDPLAEPESVYTLRHRRYTADTGRFSSPDPAKSDLNLYRYNGNDPVNQSDPSGLEGYPYDPFRELHTHLNSLVSYFLGTPRDAKVAATHPELMVPRGGLIGSLSAPVLNRLIPPPPTYSLDQGISNAGEQWLATAISSTPLDKALGVALAKDEFGQYSSRHEQSAYLALSFAPEIISEGFAAAGQVRFSLRPVKGPRPVYLSANGPAEFLERLQIQVASDIAEEAADASKLVTIRNGTGNFGWSQAPAGSPAAKSFLTVTREGNQLAVVAAGATDDAGRLVSSADDFVGMGSRARDAVPLADEVEYQTLYKGLTPEQKTQIIDSGAGYRPEDFVPHTSGKIHGADFAPRPVPSLPKYDGGKTSGVLRFGESDVPLLSGYKGPSASMPKGTVPGMHNRIKAHVEAHAAVIMREKGLKEATLCINRIPCPTNNLRSPGCFDNLPKMLPEGARLRVIGPDGFDHTFVGLPD